MKEPWQNYTLWCLPQFTCIYVHACVSMHILIKVMAFRHDGITCKSHRLSSNNPMPDIENLLWSSVQGNARDFKNIIGSWYCTYSSLRWWRWQSIAEGDTADLWQNLGTSNQKLAWDTPSSGLHFIVLELVLPVPKEEKQLTVLHTCNVYE